MDKVIKIIKLKDRDTDFSFWKTQSDMQRLDAIELLRQQYLNFKKDVQPEFQRVCRIINKKQE